MRWSSLLIGAALATVATPAAARRELEEWRWFRALSIDLVGRVPDREELAAFEKPEFDVDAWIDAHLSGPAYAERLRRIYLDLLRLDTSPGYFFAPGALVLMRQQIVLPDGRPQWLYYRFPQPRFRAETSNSLCLTAAESGTTFQPDRAPAGTPIPVAQAVLDANTVMVPAWWLAKSGPAFEAYPTLLTEPDGSPAAMVRVCREEAQAKTCSGTEAAIDASCGCGSNLEACMPSFSPARDDVAFDLPARPMFGASTPMERQPAAGSQWSRFWWSQEAVHVLDDVFASDADVRTLLTAKSTWINGPLAQFYRGFAKTACCGDGANFGYTTPDPLLDPAKIPADLAPHATDDWRKIDDRGPHAAGLLTSPVFLTKYGTRRGRAHALYTTFLCRDFVAGDVKLMPSKEPDLTKRDGCSTCHATLEPMAASFARVMEGSWTWLPAANFPLASSTCAANPASPGCATFYDAAFGGKLLGSYASPSRADEGPARLATDLANDPAFADCVVNNVTQSFLGRALSTEESLMRHDLVELFTDNGFRVRAVVRALVKSDAYRHAYRVGGGS